MGAAVWGQAVLGQARRSGQPGTELGARRRLQPLLAAEHLAFVLLVGTGLALLLVRGWGLGHARWLGLKLGLVVFLLLPLEGMHAYVCHAWIARGLRQTASPPFSKDLARGIGMDEMLRALALPLLGLAVPLLIWLSVKQPV